MALLPLTALFLRSSYFNFFSIMLINLSNHPSTAWPESQKAAAQEQFGEIEDWAFPNISPHATAEEVAQLAEDYFRRIAQATPRPRAVHLMGEMTFTFALVRRLLAAGVRCIASTTERDVVEQEGVKTSRFRFVQFRDYVL